jgi:hypothetical protein
VLAELVVKVFDDSRGCGCPKLCAQPLTCCFAASRRPA